MSEVEEEKEVGMDATMPVTSDRNRFTKAQLLAELERRERGVIRGSFLRCERQERVIVVDAGENTVRMAVDAVTEVTYLAESDMNEVLSIVKETIGTKYLKGVGKLPNRLLILIDLRSVLNSEEINRLQLA